MLATASDTRERARFFRDTLGFSVIPVKEGSKRPAVRWEEFQHRHATDAELARWFPAGEDRPFGIVCGAVSGIVVVDCDSPEAWEWARMHLPHTPMQVLTSEKAPGFDGRHLIFRHPGGTVRNAARIRTSDGKLALDVRADGGFVVAPGSLHPSGCRYEPLGDWTPGTLAELPALDPRCLEAPAPESPTLPAPRRGGPPSSAFDRARRYMQHRDPAIQGQGGDQHTFATACVLVRDFCLDDADALALLLEWNQTCRPPWREEDLVEKIRGARKYGTRAMGTLLDAPKRNGTARPAATAEPLEPAPPAEPARMVRASTFNRTEHGQAEFLVAVHGRNLLYSHPEKAWYVWDGSRWDRDERGAAGHLAMEAARARSRQALDLDESDLRKREATFGLECESARSRRAVLDQATHLPGIPVLPEALDSDPWLLNVRNGTIELQSGRVRPAQREDRITKLAPVDFDRTAPCPRWEAFLHRIMAGDQELISYLRRAAGYSLTGAIREHVLFILHGGGANGKSTFVGTLAALMGESYSQPFPVDVLLESQKSGAGPTPDLADMKGKRFAYTAEADQNRRLAEGLVKALTGGDQVKGRRLYQNSISFRPSHKLWFSTNHRPEVRGTDHGLWRRIHLIPFTVQIPEEEQDPTLPAALLAELPGILNWCLRGCQEWLRDGLRPPEAVKAATDQYRRQNDSLGEFLESCCTVHPDARVRAKDLHDAYANWSGGGMNPKRFGLALGERGFEKHRNNGIWYLGIGLLEPAHGRDGTVGTVRPESSSTRTHEENHKGTVPMVPSLPFEEAL